MPILMKYTHVSSKKRGVAQWVAGKVYKMDREVFLVHSRVNLCQV
jgi:hypothetical protein